MFCVTPEGIRADQEAQLVRKGLAASSCAPDVSPDEDDDEDLDEAYTDTVPREAMAEADATKALPAMPSQDDGSRPFPGGLTSRTRVQQGVAMDCINLQSSEAAPLARLVTAEGDRLGSGCYPDNPGFVNDRSFDEATSSANQKLPGQPSAKPVRPVEFRISPTGRQS